MRGGIRGAVRHGALVVGNCRLVELVSGIEAAGTRSPVAEDGGLEGLALQAVHLVHPDL